MEIPHLQGRISATQYRFRMMCRTIPGFLKPFKSAFYPTNLVCKLKCGSKELVRSETINSMFVLGMGFVGCFFAEQMMKENWEVSGTCTNPVKKKKLDMMGIDVNLFDTQNVDTELRSLNGLELATHLLVSIPPIIGLGDPVLYQHGDLLQSRLSDGKLQWICYLSSTSVYGDCGGAWVDEDYAANPTKESAKARLAAEERWLSLGQDLGVSVQVLRLGGIYGPGRSAVDTIIKQGSLTESQKMRETRNYTSRVHVADISQALKASIVIPSSGKIFNVVDDDPAPRSEVFAYAQTLLEKRWPGQLKLTTSGSEIKRKTTKSTGGEKRVSNARLKNELGVELAHPSYKSGLEDIIKSMEQLPFQ